MQAIDWLVSGLVGAILGYFMHIAKVRYHPQLTFASQRFGSSSLGRLLASVELKLLRLFRRLGLEADRQVPPPHWAGTYKKVGGVAAKDVTQAYYQRQATEVVRQVKQSRQGAQLVWQTADDTSVREILRLSAKLLGADGEVLYFDASSLSPLEVNQKFIANVVSWSKAVSPYKANDQSFSVTGDKFELAEFSAFLKRPRRLLQKTAMIVHGADLIRGPSPSKETVDDIFAAVLGSRLPAIITFRGKQELTEGLWDGSRSYTEQNGQLLGFATLELLNAMLAEVGIAFRTDGPRQQFRCDIAQVVLMLLTQDRRYGTRLQQILSEIMVEHLPSAIGTLVIQDIVSDLGAAEHGDEVGHGVRKLVVGLAQVPCPVPMGTVRKLWQDTALFPEAFEKSAPAPGLGEPWLLKRLISLGVVERLVPDDNLAVKPLYFMRQSFKSAWKDEESDSWHDRLQSRITSLLKDLQPPGTTPFSRYLSQGDFRPLDEFLAVRKATGLAIRLPAQVCSLITAVKRGHHTPKVALRSYCWTRRSGEKEVDVLVTISPTEYIRWSDVKRLRVHLVSREGSGKSVIKTISPYVRDVLEMEGDDYRCGPGGYVELLVVLRSYDDLVKDEKIPVLAKERIKASSSLDEALEWWFARELRAGVDELATVSLLDCTPKDVGDDFKDSTTEILGEVRLKEVAPEIYGSTGSFALDLDEEAAANVTLILGDADRAMQPAGTLVNAVYSPTSLQVFLFLKPLDLEKNVRALVGPSTNAAEGKHAILTFMNIIDRNKLNIMSVRHGPGPGYLVEVELPALEGSSVSQRLKRQYRAGLIHQLQEEAASEGIVFDPIGGLPDDLLEGLRHEIAEDEPRKRFPTNEDGVPKSAYDLVSRPDLYHRFLRKHLFIPDADAATIAFVLNCCDEDAAILEIGSGTGALTEKLLSAGVAKVDVVEPDLGLLRYWQNLILGSSYEDHGAIYSCELEDIVESNQGKYDILVSQGVHHHVATEIDGYTEDYRLHFLRLCRALLKPGGFYVLSDEFLGDYEGEAQRIARLDEWYGKVISSAIADGYPELAYLEYGFWLNDRTATLERKESVKEFLERLEGADPPLFRVERVLRFGLAQDTAGGFAVFLLRAE